MLADCFLADAVWEGTVAGRTPVGPFAGREEIVDWLAGFWPHQHDQRRHMLLNPVVSGSSGEEATLRAYLLLTSAREEVVGIETTGTYRTSMRQVGGEWRIARLDASFDVPFWPGKLENLSERGRTRHGLDRR